MKLSRKCRCATLLIGSLISATSAQAAVISVPDYTKTPDGTNITSSQLTNVNTPNGGANVLATSGQTAYIITTFTFGNSTLVDLRASFSTASNTLTTRLGIQVTDNGVVSITGNGDGRIDYDGNIAAPKRTTITLPGGGAASFMAGQSLTVIAKLYFNTSNSVTYNARSNADVATTSDDTLINVWINPTNSDVEGSGPAAGDLYSLWNSSSFAGFGQQVINNSTPAPGTTGDSSITNTTILTGADATFANALAVAVPEPNAALLGGLGMLALLRRRR